MSHRIVTIECRVFTDDDEEPWSANHIEHAIRYSVSGMTLQTPFERWPASWAKIGEVMSVTEVEGTDEPVEMGVVRCHICGYKEGHKHDCTV